MTVGCGPARILIIGAFPTRPSFQSYHLGMRNGSMHLTIGFAKRFSERLSCTLATRSPNNV